MPDKNDNTERFGGPGSSHQDREHPDKNHQPTGHKGSGPSSDTPPAPGTPTNTERSHISGGGGERDLHHRHTDERS
jgi:hypothetical protein